MSGETLFEEAPFDMASFSHPLPADAPLYCPVCGRALEYSYWDTVDGDRRYSALVCFGGSAWAWLRRRIKITYPGGTHYNYRFGPTPIAGPPRRFDPQTGRPL